MQINDQAGILSIGDIERLRRYESVFDVKVLITTAESRGSLEANVHNMVTSSNTVAIGIDPTHHYTVTHFGTGTGVPSSEYQVIARAGNGEFHAGDWPEGIRAIVAAASGASGRVAHGQVLIQQPVRVVDHPAPIWPYVLGFGVLMVALYVISRALRRKQEEVAQVVNDARDEVEKLQARNQEEQSWHDAYRASAKPAAANALEAADKVPAVRVQPQPPPRYIPYQAPLAVPVVRQVSPNPPVVIQNYPQPVVYPSGGGYYGQSSGGDLLTGVLLGEALSRPSPIIEERVVERVYETPVYDRPSDNGSSFESSSTFDDAGSSSNFDTSGSDDGGGGGGDF